MSIFSLHESKRRSLIPLAAVLLAAFYLLVFLRLSHDAEELDAPLETAWKKLALAVRQTNAATLDFASLTNALQETRRSLAALNNTRQRVTDRVDLGEDVRARMRAPFQLVDYQNERRKELDDLGKLAKQQQVTLEPPVLNGFPEHTADVKQPSLLWAELALINHLLTTAINCKVSVLHALSLPRALTNAPPAASGPLLAEIPVQLELTGSTSNVLQFLRSLPLRADELKAEGLPAALPSKPALFIDRLLLRKQAPDKPDEVRLSLRAVGFTLRE